MGEPDHPPVGVDRGHLILHYRDAVLRQSFVADGDVRQLLLARQHEVGDRARHEGGVALDQRHAYAAAAPQRDVLGRGGAAEAAAHHDHMPPALAGGSAAIKRRQCRQAERPLHEFPTSDAHRSPPAGLRDAK